MTPELISQILKVVKDAWDYLYVIAEKQIIVSLINNSILGLLCLIILIIYIVTLIKSPKYDYHLVRRDKGFSEFYNWLTDDSDDSRLAYWIIVGILAFASLIYIMNYIPFLVNFLVNPDYLIFKQILYMIPQ